jgi:hypothetical protein
VSKKRFSDQLDDLLLTSQEEVAAPVRAAASSSGSGSSQAKGHKRFLDSLGSLFEEAIQEALDSKDFGSMAGARGPIKEVKVRGIDSLIRSTANGAEVDFDFSATRRITVALDTQKLNSLKSIAKTENRFIKDIVNKAIGDFLAQYKE